MLASAPPAGRSQTVAHPQSVAPTPTRIASIDIFRGLTLAVMVFVNDADSVRGLPWWTHHAEPNVDRMTYVDMVFPFFLFILGLSLPIAVRSRLARNPSQPALWLHIFLRSLSLVVLGVIFANADDGSPTLMHLDQNAWALLALFGMVLFLGVSNGPRRTRHSMIRAGGLALTLAMLALYRRVDHGHPAWLSFDYLEILGIIGCTYFAVAVLYLSTRRWRLAPLAWFLALLALSVVSAANRIHFARDLPLLVWPFGVGTLAFVTMAGVFISATFADSPVRTRLTATTIFGVALLLAGVLFTPLGISKIRETPAWGLFSTGAAVLIFTALYWICDVRKRTAWASPFRPAGANPLLTYILPDTWYFMLALPAFDWVPPHAYFGAAGLLHSALFTVVILAVAAILTRLGIRLRL